MAKICGLSVPFPGAKRPLEEGAKLGMWEFVLMDRLPLEIPPADTYILAAWHGAYNEVLSILRGKVGVMWTSSAGEMDFEPVEQEYLREINADPRVSFIWFGDPALAQLYPRKGFYAPYPFDVEDYMELDPPVEKEDIATLFCPVGPKKNILNQLLAMELVQREKKLTLHTNVRGYDYLLNNYMPAGLDCIRHEWLPPEEYQKLIASARVNLACSWSETFNYNVAEAALMGTISVTSPTIPIPGIMVKNPNNPVHIAERILEALGNPLWEYTLAAVRSNLEFRNHECKRILSERL